MNKQVRSIALYLPQYHPIPENDRWWGKGFTEWANVAKANPLFKGHHQPHLPADLGYYDLRLDEVRVQQAEMAKAYGIYGFCYYHYWFNGRRILERPFQEVYESGKPDFPFMLCWANENWTRRWDGDEDDVLLEQKYSDEDDEKHLEYLIKYFRDPRYIRVENKPVICIYKSHLLPDPQKTAQTWRRIGAKHNMELYICHMVFSYVNQKTKHEGFDAVIDFEPFGIRREDVFRKIESNHSGKQMNANLLKKIIRKIKPSWLFKNPYLSYNMMDYDYYINNLASLRSFDYKIFPTVVPGWDNTARKNTNPSLILNNSTPEKFREWLSLVKADFVPYSDEENFIFINAWNEWAEGNHLEPCKKWGSQYLQTIKDLLNSQ